MSIMANIARKVDRIENAVDGAPSVQDESFVDTIVDLLVYDLKYQTYLADQDDEVAVRLFQDFEVIPPYSEKPRGFEILLSQLDLTALDRSQGPGISKAAEEVIARFSTLEACFQGTFPSAERRASLAERLAEAAVNLLAAVDRSDPESLATFLLAHPDKE